MRLVLDTNVVVSALLWRGLSSKLLRSGLERNIVFFTSSPLLAELTDVLSRPKLRRQISRSQMSVAQLICIYSESTVAVRARPVPRIVSDPDDDVVIGTALAANADLIVTGDNGLLSVQRYHSIRIVTVAEALQLTVSN
jgi:putative PIN family toxin of toxin-antitoxin system